MTQGVSRITDDEIIQHYKSMSIDHICKKYQTSKVRVRKVLHLAGLLDTGQGRPYGLKKLEIGYRSQTDEEYVQAVRDCHSLKELKKVLEFYHELAGDAYAVASKMTEEDFNEFQDGLRIESTGVYVGDKWNKKYGAIILPKTILEVGLLACHFNVPFGCAYIRKKESEKGKVSKKIRHNIYLGERKERPHPGTELRLDDRVLGRGKKG